MEKLIFLIFPFVAVSEVVQDFTVCSSFFLNGNAPQFTPPAGVSVRPICQCLFDATGKQTFYFATLYSTTWRIPVYSAYVFGSPPVERIDRWYIEPMLEGNNNPKCMQPEGKYKSGDPNQALNSDYGDPNFNKGHLYPVLHTDNKEAMLATSTLTNAAPQNAKFNQHIWLNHEKNVTKDLKSCQTAFVVTGVVPDRNIKLNNRVNVAKYYWSATSCRSGNLWIKRGFYGPDSGGKVQNITVEQLEEILSLKDFYGSPIKIFLTKRPRE